MRSLGMTIRYLREERGWTQLELAGRAGVSHAMVSRLECGKQGFREASLRGIARALEVSFQDLFGDEAVPSTGVKRQRILKQFDERVDRLRSLVSANPRPETLAMLDLAMGIEERHPGTVRVKSDRSKKKKIRDGKGGENGSS